MDEILRAHAARYPLWQLQDMMKLLYQSEFGPGHLIKDAGQSLLRLAQEWGQTPPDAHQPLTEPIGGGFVRVHIAAARHQGIDIGPFHDAFVASAQAPCGSVPGFESKAARLTALGVAEEAISSFLLKWRAGGCLPFSHSEVYRTHYHPAYRVVREDLARMRGP